MRRHLPLLTGETLPLRVDLPEARIAAPWSIGIAEAGQGADSLAFARELAGTLRAEGQRVRVALLAVGVSPSLTGEQPRKLAALGCEVSSHAVSLAGLVEPTIALGPAHITLLVGTPVLGLFVPALGVLLGAASASERRAVGLRDEHELPQLVLPSARVGLASMLAKRLLARDFLPRA